MHPSEVKTAAPFNELFVVDERIVEAIAQNMREYGFDTSQAIVLWDGKDLVVDGHTRLAASRRAELSYVCTVHRKFRDEDDALAYAIHNQRNRRNITEAELLRCIAVVDKRRKAGRPPKEFPSLEGNISEGPKRSCRNHEAESAQKTAKIVGTSRAKVEKARAVLSDPEEKGAVLAGKKSINRACRDAKAKRRQQAQDQVVPLPNRKPVHLTIALTPLDRGYEIRVKELPWLLSEAKTIVGCVANLAAIFENAGEKKIMQDLSSGSRFTCVA